MPYKDPEKQKEYQKKYQKEYNQKNKIINIEKYQRKCPTCREPQTYTRKENFQIAEKGNHICAKCVGIKKRVPIEKQKENRKLYDKRPEVIKRRKELNIKRREDPKVRLSKNTSRGISRSLKAGNLSKNKRHYETLIINTREEIIEHLKRHFLPGMTLENYGKWVIDHIIPIEFFEFTSTDDAEFKYMWSIDNLQPMWKKDNLKKSDKMILWGKEVRARNINRDYFSKITY